MRFVWSILKRIIICPSINLLKYRAQPQTLASWCTFTFDEMKQQQIQLLFGSINGSTFNTFSFCVCARPIPPILFLLFFLLLLHIFLKYRSLHWMMIKINFHNKISRNRAKQQRESIMKFSGRLYTILCGSGQKIPASWSYIYSCFINEMPCTNTLFSNSLLLLW